MGGGQANTIRAAWFLVGAALAVIVSVQIGILEPRRSPRVASPVPAVTPTAPVAVPIAPEHSVSKSGQADKRPRATDVSTESTPFNARPPPPSTVPPSKLAAAPPQRLSTDRDASPRGRRGKIVRKGRPPASAERRPPLFDRPWRQQGQSRPETVRSATPHAASRSWPQAYLRAQSAMTLLQNNELATTADVNQTARVIAGAAEELGHEAVALCVDRFFLTESNSSALLSCWQKLQEAMK